MEFNFTEHQQKGTRKPIFSRPIVHLGKKQFGINKAAVDKFKLRKYVACVLLYDRTNAVVGFRLYKSLEDAPDYAYQFRSIDNNITCTAVGFIRENEIHRFPTGHRELFFRAEENLVYFHLRDKVVQR